MHKFLSYNKFFCMPLHVSSTVVLIIRRSEFYYTASGIITPLTLFSVVITDAVQYSSDLLMMSTTVLETCIGI
jgi:hypothetical protein